MKRGLSIKEWKGWLPSAKLKPTFTFFGRDFAIFNTFSWQNPYQEKWKLVLALHWVASPFNYFTASASTGLSELFLNEMKRSCWWKFNFFSYCTERGWWCWCEWGMLLCKEVPKKGRPGSKKLSSQHCKWCSLSCNFTTEAFVKTSTWDHKGLAPSTSGRWIPQLQLWWAEIFSLF